MGKKLEVQLNDRSQQVCFPLRKKHIRDYQIHAEWEYN